MKTFESRYSVSYVRGFGNYRALRITNARINKKIMNIIYAMMKNVNASTHMLFI